MESDLSRVVDALPGLVWTALPDGHIDFLNRRWLEYTGLGMGDANGGGWRSAIHPEDLPEFLEQWRNMITAAEPPAVEARLRRHDGEYRRVLFRACPLVDASGQIVKWCGTGTAIDEQGHPQDPLPAHVRAFRSMADSIPALMALMNSAGEVESVNRHVLEYFGKPFEILKDWDVADTVHPDDLPTVLAAWRRAVQTGQPHESEHRNRRADGTYRWFHIRALPVRDPDGKVLRWYVLQTDIDDLKRAEKELQRSEAFLAEAQRLSSTGSFSWRLDTDEITFSDELYRIFGFEPNTIVTFEQIGTRVHPEDLPLLKDKIHRTRTTADDLDYEIRLRMPDNSVKYIQTLAHRSQDRNGRLEYIGAVQDVTPRRLSENALSKTRSELEHVSRVTSLGAFTASIAHEVSQPLAGIITNASTCLRMLAAEPPNVDGARETARRTIRDGNRASDVITRLRALFVKKDVTTELVNLNEVTREVIALSLNELQRSRVVLRSELADELPQVVGDRVQLQQVILNLFLNALEAMTGVEDRTRQLVITTKPGEDDHVHLNVQDTGVGFDPHGADRLFDAFYTTKSGGMGIGLSVSRSIVERHQGRLWVVPNNGPGATFSFSIPRAPKDVKDAHSRGATRTHAAANAPYVQTDP
jgi:PAS domain S-box-containing protein